MKKRLRLFVGSAISGVLVASALLFGAAAPASAAVMGPVDINTACYQQYGPNHTVALVSSDAYGWRCKSAIGALKSVNFNIYCSNTYGSTSWATHTPSNPYSWNCVR